MNALKSVARSQRVNTAFSIGITRVYSSLYSHFFAKCKILCIAGHIKIFNYSMIVRFIFF